MSDEPQVPVEPETPAPADTPASGAGTPEQPVEDYRKRYEDLRPEYTRATQELSHYQQQLEALKSDDPDTRIAAAQALGLELVDETPQTDDELPYVTREELTAFRQELAAQQEQKNQLETVAFLETDARNSMKDQGVPEHLQEWVLDRAVTQQYATDDGRVDVGKAYKEFTENVRAAEQKEWASTKRAPHVSPVGTEGTQAPNLDKRQDRIDWMTAQLADQ